jgi:hypothetical protein
MKTELYSIVPVSVATADRDLLRDCVVATTLLHKIMADSPALTADSAYLEIQKRLSDVCVFHWHRMRVGREDCKSGNV